MLSTETKCPGRTLLIRTCGDPELLSKSRSTLFEFSSYAKSKGWHL